MKPSNSLSPSTSTSVPACPPPPFLSTQTKVSVPQSMSVAGCAARFKELSRHLNGSTAQLLGTGKQLLTAQHDSIMAAQQAVDDCKSTLPDWQAATKGVTALASATALLDAHSKCIRSHAGFVQAAVARFNSTALAAHTRSVAREREQLFAIMYTPMLIYHALPPSWPISDYMLVNPQLYSALHAVATLLCSLPTPKAVLTKLHAKDGITPTLLLLAVTVRCLSPTSGALCAMCLLACRVGSPTTCAALLVSS